MSARFWLRPEQWKCKASVYVHHRKDPQVLQLWMDGSFIQEMLLAEQRWENKWSQCLGCIRDILVLDRCYKQQNHPNKGLLRASESPQCGSNYCKPCHSRGMVQSWSEIESKETQELPIRFLRKVYLQETSHLHTSVTVSELTNYKNAIIWFGDL